ncbi:MAG: hypothetical protein EOL87_01275 [Spartobacteria bacterium]|nr:hypothetical protein [Spartobacteria bacterium]
MIGTFSDKTSNEWNFLWKYFQSLELFSERFPIIGKRIRRQISRFNKTLIHADKKPFLINPPFGKRLPQPEQLRTKNTQIESTQIIESRVKMTRSWKESKKKNE